MSQFPVITASDLEESAKEFKRIEPRGLFYVAATELVKLAIDGTGQLNVAEALCVLLQTWNKAYYQYRPFKEEHLFAIEKVLERHWLALAGFRNRSIESLHAADKEVVVFVFADFEHILGPVGAAKSLHLLAPMFFPIWDIEIAKRYRVGMRRRGNNGKGYFGFMEITLVQIKSLSASGIVCPKPLKAIDEHNYVTITIAKRGAQRKARTDAAGKRISGDPT